MGMGGLFCIDGHGRVFSTMAHAHPADVASAQQDDDQHCGHHTQHDFASLMSLHLRGSKVVSDA